MLVTLTALLLAAAPVSPSAVKAPAGALERPVSRCELRDQQARDNRAFLARREHEQCVRALRLAEAGLGPDLAAVRRRLARSVPVRVNDVFQSGSEREQVHRQNVEWLAQFLVETGYRARDVNGAAGELLVASTIKALMGSPGAADPALVAPTVVLAERLGTVVGPAAGSAPRVSATRYRIVEPLKNGPPAGTEILVLGGPVHYADGTSSFSTPDLQAAAPGRYLLLLSRTKASLAASAAPNVYANALSSYRVEGELLRPTGESNVPETRLSVIRAALRRQACLRTGKRTC